MGRLRTRTPMASNTALATPGPNTIDGNFTQSLWRRRGRFLRKWEPEWNVDLGHFVGLEDMIVAEAAGLDAAKLIVGHFFRNGIAQRLGLLRLPSGQ